MSEIEKIQRYIDNTHIKNRIRYDMRQTDILQILVSALLPKGPISFPKMSFTGWP